MRRTCRKPSGVCAIEATEKAEVPPPDGSTATKTCWVFLRGLRAS